MTDIAGEDKSMGNMSCPTELKWYDVTKNDEAKKLGGSNTLARIPRTPKSSIRNQLKA